MKNYGEYSMTCKKDAVKKVREPSEGKWLITEVKGETVRERNRDFVDVIIKNQSLKSKVPEV